MKSKRGNWISLSKRQQSGRMDDFEMRLDKRTCQNPAIPRPKQVPLFFSDAEVCAQLVLYQVEHSRTAFAVVNPLPDIMHSSLRLCTSYFDDGSRSK